VRAARRLAAPAAALVLLTGCTSFAETLAGDGPGAPAGPGEPLYTPPCPAERAEPDPDRPRIELDFRLEDDLRTVTGMETVVFTPDLPTDRLVFRLVPNNPGSLPDNGLSVDEVRGEDVEGGGYRGAEADDPGGLYVVDLDRELAAGESTELELDFTLTLAGGDFDRLGTDDDVSWWASGFPLLAWEPGVGWAEDPFVSLLGETTTSPAADTTVSVSVPEQLTVLMTGDQAAPAAAEGGRRTWTSTEPVARDVSVAVGAFSTEERTSDSGVRVTVGVLPGADLAAAELAERTVRAIGELEQRLGPFPYETLTVPLLPDYGGGIEYPSSILEATPSYDVLVHEVAHMWFYGMVGNSQFRDPWLDEAFATYAEAVLAPPPDAVVDRALGQPGEVGATMEQFAEEQAGGEYFDVVYGKGGAALLTAREAAGAEDFDAAIRCYVDANAWTIATPADLLTVLGELPTAVAVLDEAGAIDKADAAP
jgi:Peptidase family M1 domain